MEQFLSLSHLELRLDLAAESGEELGELLIFRVTLKVDKDFHASGFIPHIGQADRSQVRVL